MMSTYSEFEFILSLLMFFSIIFPIFLFFTCYGVLSCLIFVICQVSRRKLLEKLMGSYMLLLGILEEVIDTKRTGN